MTKTGNRIPNRFYRLMAILAIAFLAAQCSQSDSNTLKVRKGDHIILIGNNLGSRMMNFGHFETELQLRYPDSLLYIRNMCDGGDTPVFDKQGVVPAPVGVVEDLFFREKLQHGVEVPRRGKIPDGTGQKFRQRRSLRNPGRVDYPP